MTDINGTDMSLRSVFAKKAELPQKEIHQAEKFLHELAATGSVTPKAKENGERLLKTLEERKEVYAFHATVIAAQEETSETELDRKLESIGAALEKVDTTVERLKKALSPFASATA